MGSRRPPPYPNFDVGQAPADRTIWAATISEFEAPGKFAAGFEATQMNITVAAQKFRLGGANDAVGVVRRPLLRTAFVPVAWFGDQ